MSKRCRKTTGQENEPRVSHTRGLPVGLRWNRNAAGQGEPQLRGVYRVARLNNMARMWSAASCKGGSTVVIKLWTIVNKMAGGRYRADGETRKMSIVTAWANKGKSPLGRQRCRWKNNTKIKPK